MHTLHQYTVHIEVRMPWFQQKPRESDCGRFKYPCQYSSFVCFLSLILGFQHDCLDEDSGVSVAFDFCLFTCRTVAWLCVMKNGAGGGAPAPGRTREQDGRRRTDGAADVGDKRQVKVERLSLPRQGSSSLSHRGCIMQR